MNARRLVLTAFLSLSVLTASALSGAPVALAESCPNVAERVGFSAALPDCRAYEAVSEPGSDPFFNSFGDPGVENVTPGGTRLVGGPQGAVASVTGERMAYYSITAPPGSLTDGPYYLATRGQDGWSTENTIPRQSLDIGLECLPLMVAYTPDLSKGILANGRGQQANGSTPTYNCGHDEPLLVAGEPQGFENLFVRDNETAFYELVNDTPVGVPANDAFFQAASSDLSHVVFDEHAELTPEAPVGDDLYEWSGGVVRLVTILPDGTPVQGSVGNTTQANGTENSLPNAANFTHAVSADGSRVFFQADGNLYVRENADREQSPLDGKGSCADPAKACSLEVDASQAGGTGGGGTFMWADTTGSKVFFTDESKLTSDSTATPGKPDLYEYDLDAGGERLTDLTVNPGESADVLSVSGTSEDGSYVYFVAEGALTGQEENGHGGKAESGIPNLYLRHEGKTTFIAALQAGQDECDWALYCLTVRVSLNGMFVGFNSVDSLTGYDNTPAQPGDCLGANVPRSCDEIFLYDAARNELSCASCDPSGLSPTAPSAIGPPEQDSTLIDTPSYLQRNVLDDGRVFFATYGGLLPNDGNNASDVYEYEDGQLHLISNSTGGGSFFFDASASGSDVFFVTGQHLLPGAVATSTILYDARVNGGFPEPPGSPTACSEEDCKGAVTPVPLFAPPSSATFVGAGNPAPVTTVHKSSKQVKKKPKKKHAAKKKRKKGSKDRKSSRVMRTVRLHVGGVR